jgi:hypothetical protein
MKTKQKKNDKVVETTPEKNKDFYFNQEAKNWEFADYVSLGAGPRGIMLSFGKYVQEDKKYGIFKEIMLPFDVAESLSKVIQDQFKVLLEKGLIEKVEAEK